MERYISKQECAQYEESVKYYRDIKNVVDTSHEEGREEERIAVIKRGLAKGYSVEIIANMTGLSEGKIRKLSL